MIVKIFLFLHEESFILYLLGLSSHFIFIDKYAHLS